MYNDGLLFQLDGFETVKRINFSKNKCISYSNNDKYIDLYQIRKMRNFLLNLIENRFYLNFPISFNLGSIEFEDKLTIILMEVLCYHLIRKYDCQLSVQYKCKKDISTAGISFSPLQLLNTLNGNANLQFKNRFEKDIAKTHYRRLLRTEDNNDKMLANKLMQDIYWFLKHLFINEECCLEITDVVTELIDNALEHSNSDCLVDLDVTNDYVKKDGEGKICFDTFYCGVNIVIINFSENLLGQQLKNKLLDDNDLPERYNMLKTAYLNHSKSWTGSYFEDDFYVVASFQDKISGRKDTSSTGGTGLTKLLRSIEQKSDKYNCYMLSGNRIFYFDHTLIKYDQDDWVGFNSQNDFINYPPDFGCFQPSKLFFPGTAYNLNFVLERECEHNENT